MSGDGGTGPLPSGRDVLIAGIRSTLRTEPDFRPTDAQMARYEKLGLPDDILAELRRRHQTRTEASPDQE